MHVYYFEGLDGEIRFLANRLSYIFEHMPYPKYSPSRLEYIWTCLGEPFGIPHDGEVIGTVADGASTNLPGLCLLVRGEDCRALWDRMLAKWAPHCRYYYLTTEYYGLHWVVTETNDMYKRYVSADYVMQACVSANTSPQYRALLRKGNGFHLSGVLGRYDEIHYTFWSGRDLQRLLLPIVPRPDLPIDDWVYLANRKLRRIRFCEDTSISVTAVRRTARQGRTYVIPSLERMRQQGIIQ